MVNECLVCGTPTKVCLDLGTQPLANNLLSALGETYETFPLGLNYCPRCAHAQLSTFVPPEKLFENYLYASGTSGTLRAYFKWLARSILREIGSEAYVLDIASNDGSFLDTLRDAGLRCKGVDPAVNLSRVAAKKGHDVICDYFPSEALTEKFDVITAMNVFAHNPAPIDFLRGVATHLSDDGVALIQTSQALMLEAGEFDTIYHEHYSFFTKCSVEYAAQAAGLFLNSVELTDIHGTSSLFILSKSSNRTLGFSEKSPFQRHIPATRLPEFPNQSDIPRVYNKFAASALRCMGDVRQITEDHRADGFNVVLVGTAAKALTFVNAAGLEIDEYLDEADLKIGRFVPGAPCPISGFSEISKYDKVLIVVGAWNFFDEISKKLRALVLPTTNVKFLRYFPDVEVTR